MKVVVFKVDGERSYRMGPALETDTVSSVSARLRRVFRAAIHIVELSAIILAFATTSAAQNRVPDQGLPPCTEVIAVANADRTAFWGVCLTDFPDGSTVLSCPQRPAFSGLAYRAALADGATQYAFADGRVIIRTKSGFFLQYADASGYSLVDAYQISCK